MKDIPDQKDFLKQDVILTWPGKDCISNDGSERKLFTGFQLHTVKGEEEVTGLNNNNNFIIKGDNLAVLHSVKDVFAGKVKLIYIDPPYNTGK